MKYERFNAARSGENKDLDPTAKYQTALSKYFWGVTPLEITADVAFKTELLDTIGRFGGYDKAIDPHTKIAKNPRLPRSGMHTVEEYVQSVRQVRPEFADVLDSAIVVQQRLYKGNEQPTQDVVIDSLLTPINSSSLGWSVEEASAIRQIGYSTIDDLARTDGSFSRDIEIFSNNFRRLTKGYAKKEPVIANQKRATRKTKFVLEQLRDRQRAMQKHSGTEVANSLAEATAAVSIGNLDKRVSQEHSVPRIARETYVDYLAGALFFRKYPEDIYVKEEKRKKVKIDVPPLTIQSEIVRKPQKKA